MESEKANLIDAIRGLKNDKRDWADIRLMQEMCAGEPYSVLRLGDEETAGRITNQSLYVHGQALMASSRVEVIYCGSAEAQRVEDAVLTALAALPRGAQTALPEVQRIQAPDTPRRIVETMDVTQGKLAMGYRCSSDDYPAMVLANLIFGGTSNSKLFLNVRERLSLCYYASSSYARSKNILTVSSGVRPRTLNGRRRRSATSCRQCSRAIGRTGSRRVLCRPSARRCCHCRTLRVRWRISIWARSRLGSRRHRRSWPRRWSR